MFMNLDIRKPSTVSHVIVLSLEIVLEKESTPSNRSAWERDGGWLRNLENLTRVFSQITSNGRVNVIAAVELFNCAVDDR